MATTKIPNELESAVKGGFVTNAAMIVDRTDPDNPKAQNVINQEVGNALDNRYTKDEVYNKEETYNKTQLDNMITTPEIAYKDYDTYAAMVAETEHPNGAIYRVANYDGTQVDNSKYAEYSWDGTQYKLMAVRDHGVDDVPTAGSNNFVKSSGVKSCVDNLDQKVVGSILGISSQCLLDGRYSSSSVKIVAGGKYIVLPIKQGDNISFTTNATNPTPILVLAEYNYNEAMPYSPSFATGESARGLVNNRSDSLSAPSDAKWLFVSMVSNSNTDMSPQVLTINGIDYLLGIRDIVSTLKTDISTINSNIVTINSLIASGYLFKGIATPSTNPSN